MNSKGFTILEILIAVAIIGLLTIIAIPTLSMMTARGQSTQCLSNLRQIGVALNLYLGDHDMEMPSLLAGRRSLNEEGPVMDQVLAAYLDDLSVFQCPADRSLGQASGTSYYWNVALNGQRAGSLNFLELVDKSSRIPVLSDKEGWHRYRDNKVNFLYADGHATKDLQLFTGD